MKFLAKAIVTTVAIKAVTFLILVGIGIAAERNENKKTIAYAEKYGKN